MVIGDLGVERSCVKRTSNTRTAPLVGTTPPLSMYRSIAVSALGCIAAACLDALALTGLSGHGRRRGVGLHTAGSRSASDAPTTGEDLRSGIARH